MPTPDGRVPTKHIALFVYALSGGGAQRRVLTLANGFAERGHEVDLVVVRSGGVLEAKLHPAVRLVALDRSGRVDGRAVALGSRRGFRTFASIPALARYLRRNQPDVLLSGASHVNLVAVAAWKLARLPIALVLRASNYPSGNLAAFPPAQRLVRLWMRALARRFYPLADKVIAVSQGVAAELSALTGLDAERLEVIYNPVFGPELERQLAEPLPPHALPEDGPPIVLGCGTFKPQKDFATLIDAFARVVRRLPARLVLLGDGPLRPALEARVRALGLAESVRFPGFVLNPLPWMRRASVFVLSSLWEGLPGVVIEALAAGCPVVATDCPSGPREILADGRFGRLVPVGDAAALAAAILDTLANPPDPAGLRDRARAFAVDTAIDRYLSVLDGCIRARVPARLARIPPWPIRRPLAETSDAGIDYVLGRLAMSRGQLFTEFPGNAAHRLRLAAMLRRLGIDPSLAAQRSWTRLREMDARCSRCLTVRSCLAWLATTGHAAAPPDFCPNARALAALGASATARR
ncbi:N-acetylgalactosamine-N, N'-diacetylbacillosaminyl-diphospho-undecaprenol4-alpha-N-acetylgalactosaminyltransferase [bacterium HR40]|nr:N-acetylgalactosamine-N, N'-diacetylbacillosaminyl-diphospho-undecaprenol4-alpha-N-acetylgalactosaminyltransferase [bacterium HR40]